MKNKNRLIALLCAITTLVTLVAWTEPAMAGDDNQCIEKLRSDPDLVEQVKNDPDLMQKICGPQSTASPNANQGGGKKRIYQAPSDTLTCISPAEKRTQGSVMWCECEDGYVAARLVNKTGHAFNKHHVEATCVPTQETLENLENQLDGLIKDFDKLRKQKPDEDFSDLQKQISALLDKFKDKEGVAPGEIEALKKRMDDLEKRMDDLEGADLEWDLAPYVIGVIPFEQATSTVGFGGQFGFTGWPSRANGIRVGVFAGPGFNSDSKRLLIGGDVLWTHAFGDKRIVRLKLGGTGIVQPNDSGNEASFVGGKVGVRINPDEGILIIDLALALGILRSTVFDDGVRTDQRTNYVGAAVPSLAAGFLFH